MCDPYIWEDPRYLFRHIWLDKPRASCASEFVNQSIFVYIVAVIAGLIVSSLAKFPSALWIAIVIATIYLIPTFLSLRSIEKFRIEITRDNNGNDTGIPDSVAEGYASPQKEGFAERRNDMNENVKGVVGNPSTLSFQNQTQVGVRNPFANVTLDELPDGHTVPNLAPYRKGAPDITATKKKVDLDAFFRVNWYNDPTDVFGKTQSQRMFVSAPSTTIPNDQGSYQNWLYRIPGKTCKEGNPAACYAGTEGAAIPWLNT